MPIDASLNVIPVTDVNDPRLRPYTALKDRQLAAEMGLFVCEGEHNVHRLLASKYTAHSLLVAEHRLAELSADLPENTPVYTASNDLLSRVVGFQFHLGVLACGVRPWDVSFETLLPARTLVVLPEVRHAENLGLVIRAAHALGADGLLLSDIGCDPFTRRVIRVSMGSVFGLPVVRSASLAEDLQRLRDSHGFTLIAAVSDTDATPVDQFIRQAGGGVAVLLGNEPDGLDAGWIGLCDRKVTIPMAPGVDSLNLAVAAGIVLHQLALSDPRYRPELI
jgi:tRNA G18 (ribose-2'-O)-methylase SpoU